LGYQVILWLRDPDPQRRGSDSAVVMIYSMMDLASSSSSAHLVCPKCHFDLQGLIAVFDLSIIWRVSWQAGAKVKLMSHTAEKVARHRVGLLVSEVTIYRCCLQLAEPLESLERAFNHASPDLHGCHRRIRHEFSRLCIQSHWHDILSKRVMVLQPRLNLSHST